MEKNRKKKRNTNSKENNYLHEWRYSGRAGLAITLTRLPKLKRMPRLTEQIGLLVLQLDPCNFVLLQLALFISYRLSIIVL